MKFVYELGEVVSDSWGARGMIIERQAQTYKVAFVAEGDGMSSCVTWCSQDDLFPPHDPEEDRRMELWDQAYDKAIAEGKDRAAALVEARRAERGLRLVR